MSHQWRAVPRRTLQQHCNGLWHPWYSVPSLIISRAAAASYNSRELLTVHMQCSCRAQRQLQSPEAAAEHKLDRLPCS